MKSCKYYFDTEAKRNYDNVHAIYVSHENLSPGVSANSPSPVPYNSLFLSILLYLC